MTMWLGLARCDNCGYQYGEESVPKVTFVANSIERIEP